MSSRYLRWTVLTVLFLVLVVMTASALIRLTQAGFGCADWPTCQGTIFQMHSAANPPDPAASPLRWVRALHRVAASMVSVLLVLVVGAGWKALGAPQSRAVALVALAVTGGLAWLGRVSASPLPSVTIGNLLGGMILVALLWWLYLRGLRARGGVGRASIAFALVVQLAQVATGGMAFFDSSAPKTAFILVHGFGVVLVAAVISMLAFKALRRGGYAAVTGWALLAILTVQSLSGAGIAVGDRSLLLALVHNFCAALLLAATAGLDRSGSRLPKFD